MDYLTKNDFAYLTLKQEILNGTIEPGSRLVANTIAKQYGISTIPVREAINRLTQEGLVTSIPHVGASVRTYNFDEMFDTLIMLFPLCKLALQLTATNITKSQIEELREQLALIKSHHDSDGNRFSYDTHSQFHLMAFSCHENKALKNTIAKEMPNTQQIFNIPYFSDDQWAIAQNEHDELISALENHDANDAIAILRNHYYKAVVRFLDYVKVALKDSTGERHNYYLNSLADPSLANDPIAFKKYYLDKVQILLSI